MVEPEMMRFIGSSTFLRLMVVWGWRWGLVWKLGRGLDAVGWVGEGGGK